MAWQPLLVNVWSEERGGGVKSLILFAHKDVDECQTITCANGGRCVNTDGSFECKDCLEGWTGQLCNTNIDECTLPGNPVCKNGGLCTDTEGGVSCNCTGTGYEGTRCDVDVDECDGDPCLHGGLCSNSVGSYACTCTDAFYGKNCEIG
ncbi:FAT4-like protein [Mya arenaria]|uniref:FAT4-like protein n=1 Tax=Mya arenaria TaxID=6604 RepID=A0ABY7G2B9_MYAAR|nr:FAT4-like protein [Mya arenaria]